MAPSRGHFRRATFRSIFPKPIVQSILYNRRTLSSASFSQELANPARKVQSYISTSRDPYLNLSIEDYILRASPADSTVLFLYVNRPCVVIGRNQNPWSEVNLGILCSKKQSTSAAFGHVDLVRRRSGGGAVFHDEGNLNWSITCPRSQFTRDTHAEMVVRALRKLGIDRARVNERHDIVLDQGPRQESVDPVDTHRTSYTVQDGPRPLKVSGSAYKLTSARALHHATTLLSSPNLPLIPQYLRSPAKNAIQAKGVESVSSPVSNIGLDVQHFQVRLQEEFAIVHSSSEQRLVVQELGEEHLSIPAIRKGYDELRTNDWMWSQTPQFTLSLQPYLDLEISIRHGIIQKLEGTAKMVEEWRSALLGHKLQDVRSWSAFLQNRLDPWTNECAVLANYLEVHLPVPELFES
ncbi:hypothetical protein DM02DRAFT_513606 [Periconia macrospinosa]|uniref:Putative lipoate-protein ligase A n=1 Tax=Periconia macrospinosa TaxID=97972 RepID=A0A2V1EC72_9PLEO|nr:hypothetical protein DM02DRAFT_513606 [Periconia macrospinosa]